MERFVWLAALTLPLMAAPVVQAEITKAVMGVRGAEMT
jgi:hypothetical protein